MFAGKTGMVTVGVVFSNSEHANGGFWKHLTRDDWKPEGLDPYVSVMLFGSAYSAFAKLRARQVVALSQGLTPSKKVDGRRHIRYLFVE
jgi:hypothetical protein